MVKLSFQKMLKNLENISKSIPGVMFDPAKVNNLKGYIFWPSFWQFFGRIGVFEQQKESPRSGDRTRVTRFQGRRAIHSATATS